MCEYIIMEDFSMDKYIYDDKNDLWYELQGDYYIPCLMSYLTSRKRTAYRLMGTATLAVFEIKPQDYIP